MLKIWDSGYIFKLSWTWRTSDSCSAHLCVQTWKSTATLEFTNHRLNIPWCIQSNENIIDWHLPNVKTQELMIDRIMVYKSLLGIEQILGFSWSRDWLASSVWEIFEEHFKWVVNYFNFCVVNWCKSKIHNELCINVLIVARKPVLKRPSCSCGQGRNRHVFLRGQSHFSWFFPGVKCFFPVENSHFGRPKTNFCCFQKWKAKKKKKKKLKKYKIK